MIPIRLKLLGIVILLLLLGVKYHPRFELQTVSVVGTHFVPSESLVAFTKRYAGQNTAWVRFFSRISSRIEEVYPQIESIDLDIVSNTEIQITVHEKKPWIGMAIGGKTLFVAQDGTVLNLIADRGEVEEFMTLLFVHGVPASMIENHKVYGPFIESLQPVVETIQRQFPHRALQLRFSHLQFEHRILTFRDVDVVRDDVMTIRLGNFDEFERKFKVLHQYLSLVKPEEYQLISVIDLRMIPKLWVVFND
jgi:hypothetical protein